MMSMLTCGNNNAHNDYVHVQVMITTIMVTIIYAMRIQGFSHHDMSH